VRTVLTTCPFCACGCGLYLHADGNLPVGVAASPHHPISVGRLCARGWSAHHAAAWGPRLTRPLLRRDGQRVELGWDEALDAAASRLDDLRRRRQSIGVIASPRLSNEDSYLTTRLARAALGTPNIDAPLRADYERVLAAIAAVTGGWHGLGSFEEIEKADLILLIEGDLAGSHPRAASAVTRAVAGGARLICFGQLPTQMARLACTSFPMRCGAESAAVAPLLSAVLAATAAGARVGDQPAGMDALRTSLAGVSASQAEREAAQWCAEAAAPSLLVAPFATTGVSLHQLALAVADLAVLLGLAGRPGAVLLVLPTRSNARGSLEMGVTPEALPGGRALGNADLADRLAAAWGARPVVDRGLSGSEMLGRTAGLVIVGDALAGDLPAGVGPLAELLAGTELVVALGAFESAVVERADVVLPIAAVVETAGTVTSADGRIQRLRPCVAPPGGARAAGWVLAELSRRLGLPAAPTAPERVLAELTKLVPGYEAVDEESLDRGWGARVRSGAGGGATLRPVEPLLAAADGRLVMLEGVYDWGSDPLVVFSPILCRDERSRRKLFPRGQVAMSPADAEAVGVRQGWAVRLISEHGEAVLPVVLRRELAPGCLSVPFAFRDGVAGVLGGAPAASVRVERA
jgi:predicted molibdopterin-dependent oxidoreductase YjgC